MNLMWFRNDLRLADNPALFHALSNNNHTLALFIITPGQHLKHGEAPAKLELIKAHINDLINRLKNIGVGSVVCEVPYFADVADVFEQLHSQYKFDRVYLNASYWINEVNRDRSVKKILNQLNVQYKEYHSNYLLPPGTIRKSDGTMYHVFTPYKNKFVEKLKKNYQLPFSIPFKDDINEAIRVDHGSKTHRLKSDFHHESWPIGEKAVATRVKQFVETSGYKHNRDFPAIAGTSSLSPYLTIGVISARQCLAHAIQIESEDAFYSTWISELIWRDFYNDLMYEYPHLAKHKTFKSQANDQWVDNPDIYSKWQLGQTGFPIIDAGMRQLLAEGWMHNRVRMLVASFLCKLCLIDWRKGEAHFMSHLLDGDLASNNGGWQWSSATGCDAAPYFRIFNPTTQSKKFDPNGTYIKRYVPELADLESKIIHDPKPELRDQCGYPMPIIDYKSARSRALAWFKGR